MVRVDLLVIIGGFIEDMKDYNKSLNFAIMGAYLLKTNVDKWKHCAYLAVLV
jgi:hypothetical protein